nr:class I SAM-dependent methyltransferase [Bacillus testis]
MALDNFEEYADPILYDKENESFISEMPFLIKWASKKQGTIIDLACGTGRVTIPLAKNGYKLIGVDLHKGMLNEARKKSFNLDLQIDWIEQDCTMLDLNVKSNMIYSVGNSFQYFLTNEAQDRLLSSVNKHLDIDGVFIFGTRFPSVEELLQPQTEEYWRTYTDRDTQEKVDLYTISAYDSLKQIQHYTTIRKYKNIDDVFPKEMERILLVNGFEILHLYRDWR